MSEYGPLGLTHRNYGNFDRDVDVSVLGAGINVAQGQITTNIGSPIRQEIAPHGLPTTKRSFSKTSQIQDVFPAITGAFINGQAAFPDSANAAIYVDSVVLLAEGGDVADDIAFVSTAAIAADAGTVNSTVSLDVSLPAAAISVASGSVSAIGDASGIAQVIGAESLGEAQAITVTTDQIFTIAGALLSVQGSEVGIDTDAPVSVTVTGAAIAGQAAIPTEVGAVVSVNVVGAQSLAVPGIISTDIDFLVVPVPESTFGDYGALIINNDAVTYPSNYVICERTGFRVRRGGLVSEWNNTMVRPESYESRHPQDFVRSRAEKQEGSPRPEQDDRFVGEDVPQVTADSL